MSTLVLLSAAKLKRGQTFAYGEGWGRSTYIYDRRSQGQILARLLEARHQVYGFDGTEMVEVLAEKVAI